MYFRNKGKDLGIQFSCQSNSIVFIVHIYSVHVAETKGQKKPVSFKGQQAAPPAHYTEHKQDRDNRGCPRQTEAAPPDLSCGSTVRLRGTHSAGPENACASCSFLEISCRGERIRDYYQKQQGYAACQTTKKVSRLECRGGCAGGQCCGPLRSKRRKYSFECTDGSSFVDEVEKVVKCGCTRCAS